MNTNVEGIMCILGSLRFMIQETRIKKRFVIKNNDTTITSTNNLFVNKKTTTNYKTLSKIQLDRC